VEIVRIEPGTFTMGSHEPIGVAGRRHRLPAVKLMSERPPHRVHISRPFYLGRYPVTLREYREFADSEGEGERKGAWVWDAGAWARKDDADYLHPNFPQGDDHPVVCVDWEQAGRFCRWLSRRDGHTYRLPTEAEWEYACRAGSLDAYCFGGNEEELGDYAWYWVNSGARTHPVGLKKPNAWGLYDMHGNVLEWCLDWFGPYPEGELVDPRGPAEGLLKVARGGSWLVYAHNLRSSDRCALLPSVRHADLGFRVVREC
jgi:formylglycine-generating enzyme required for sulfatase activity